MNVFGVGLPEIAVIGALALIIFGPKRLPELGRNLGKTLKGFQQASSEFEREIKKAMETQENSDSLEEQIHMSDETPEQNLSSVVNQTTENTHPPSAK